MVSDSSWDVLSEDHENDQSGVRSPASGLRPVESAPELGSPEGHKKKSLLSKIKSVVP